MEKCSSVVIAVNILPSGNLSIRLLSSTMLFIKLLVTPVYTYVLRLYYLCQQEADSALRVKRTRLPIFTVLFSNKQVRKHKSIFNTSLCIEKTSLKYIKKIKYSIQ